MSELAKRVINRRMSNYTGSALINKTHAKTKFSKSTAAGKKRRAALANQYKALRKQGHKRAYHPVADTARYRLMRGI